jgi:hypothetical protein
LGEQRSTDVNIPLRRYGLPALSAALLASVIIGLTATVGAQTPGGGTPDGQTPVGTDVPTVIIQPTGDLVPTSTEGPPAETPSTEPAPTEEPTPGPEVQTLVSLALAEGIEQPIPEGDEFEVRVLVEQVEHLAGFEFAIAYDPDKIEPVLASESADGTPGAGGEDQVRMANQGQVLLSDGRDQDSILCSEGRVVGNTAALTCSILEAPVCAGGQPGVDGGGLLASVFFRAAGGGITTLDVDSTLVLDDVVPPCPENEEDEFQIQTIPHRRQGLDIELKADEGSSLLLIGGIVVGVVAVVAVVGGGGYMYLRSRRTPAA